MRYGGDMAPGAMTSRRDNVPEDSSLRGHLSSMPPLQSSGTLQGHQIVFDKYPWHLKEVPICFNSTLCPSEANNTWDYYFDYLTDVDVRSFVLGGYAIRKSRIAADPEFYPPWNKTGFNELRRRVDAVGGRILADLGVYGDKTFDKKAFLGSAAKFTEDYRVDGFQLKVSFWDSDVIPPLKEAFKAIKELRLHSSLWFSTDDWEKVSENGLGKIADTNFVIIWPHYPDQVQAFNTDRFAEEDINTLVMTIPLLARSTYDSSDVGYSNAIYDLGGDPKGDGSVIYSPGDGFYFFSQPRAIDKIAVAKKHGLQRYCTTRK
ncbi:hypothetical protein FOZ60_002616 [Perkinsus olseni]|uniref:Uncharacterized protein n=1 Tax=Perkinsus olseni TaxID=32597 RepID=A0A7J6NXF8_PEROL|nr:hypothetical protein FOZ60_002616 [Perkinsus olseni]